MLHGALQLPGPCIYTWISRLGIVRITQLSDSMQARPAIRCHIAANHTQLPYLCRLLSTFITAHQAISYPGLPTQCGPLILSHWACWFWRCFSQTGRLPVYPYQHRCKLWMRILPRTMLPFPYRVLIFLSRALLKVSDFLPYKAPQSTAF